MNKNQTREVHAWLIGDIVETVPADLTGRAITYNPYRCGSFTFRDTGANLDRAAFVALTATDGAIAYD